MNHRSIAACIALAALLFASPAARAQTRGALRIAAQRGDTAAMLRLAEAYRFGQLSGVVYDDSATYFLRMAADRDVAEAQYLLGISYLRGLGVAQNPAQGLQWLERATRRGSREAPEALLEAYTQPLTFFGPSPVPMDARKAAQYAETGAKRGSETCAFYLAEAYLKGKGVPRNDSLAVFWLDYAAAKLHYPKAQLLIGEWFFMARTAFGADFPRAVRYYEQAAANPRADFEQQAMAKVGLHNIEKLERRLYNLRVMLGFIDPQTAPALRVRL